MFIRFQLETGSHKIYYLATWKKLCLTLTLTLTLNNSIKYIKLTLTLTLTVTRQIILSDLAN